MAARGDPPATVGGMEELAGRGPRLPAAERPTGLVAVARPPVPGAERRAVGLLRSGQRRAVVDPGIALALGQPEPGADDVAGGRRGSGRRGRARTGRSARVRAAAAPGRARARRSRSACRRSRAPSPVVAPVQNAACHASSIARRRSARSGSRSGMSRRSTSRPPSPPPTSTSIRRPRVPRPTGSRKRRSTGGDLAGRQVDQLEPAGDEVELVSPADRDDRQPSGAPAGPQALRDDDAAERAPAGRRPARRRAR